jgi:hypothetical protein
MHKTDRDNYGKISAFDMFGTLAVENAVRPWTLLERDSNKSLNAVHNITPREGSLDRTFIERAETCSDDGTLSQENYITRGCCKLLIISSFHTTSA